jgi:hypothetical protein
MPAPKPKETAAKENEATKQTAPESLKSEPSAEIESAVALVPPQMPIPTFKKPMPKVILIAIDALRRRLKCRLWTNLKFPT